jgi:hypothetical protein
LTGPPIRNACSTWDESFKVNLVGFPSGDGGFAVVDIDTLWRDEQGRVNGAKRLKLIILDACRDNPFAKTMSRTIEAGGATRASCQTPLYQ